MKQEDQVAFRKLSREQLLSIRIYGEAKDGTYDQRRYAGSEILRKVKKGNFKDVVIGSLEGHQDFSRLVYIARSYKDSWFEDMRLRGCFDMASGLLEGLVKRSKEPARSL